ncbi:lipid-binding protein [Marinilabilia salmonicolor]|uniref:Lipid-binding putative hydrolase n=1 Tax=Marinilabilia salmonicolor TaxID=989 RepID=A0A368UJ13_9BACT|nr:lipid-binding protein [Marinilabilia salmonicolor]RCW26072.1 lipid-binding putative hydrolase [Marinilabilia salmonicolor]
MKKIIIFLSILLSTGFFVACDEELEVWDSETLEYSGRWHFKVQGENGDVVKEYGSHTLHTYNSAANVEDELWLDDVNNVLNIRVKFDISGDPTNFKSVDVSESAAGENVKDYPAPAATPEEGATAVEDNFFNKATILEGKVLKGAGVSKTGDPVDSIYLKLNLFAGEVVYNSVFDDVTETYVWDEGTFSYYPESDSVVVLSGTMYTGFPEDEY